MTHPVFISLETSAFSGATLLAILLGSHPDMTTVGEMRGLIDRANPDTYLCSCGKRIVECEFWEAVTRGMHQRGYQFDVTSFDTKFLYRGPRLWYDLKHGSSRNYLLDLIRDKIVFSLPSEKRSLKKYVERNAAFVESVLEVTGNNIFVDSSKSKMLLRTFPKYTDYDVRAIHLIRRAEGVVASQLRRSPDTIASVEAQSWVKRHRRIELSLRFLPQSKSTHVRYEDVCADTDRTLKKLFKFCGVESDVSRLNFDVKAQHIIGNPMRLKPLSAISSDERWRRELTEDQISQVRKIADSFSRAYGYEAT